MGWGSGPWDPISEVEIRKKLTPDPDPKVKTCHQIRNTAYDKELLFHLCTLILQPVSKCHTPVA